MGFADHLKKKQDELPGSVLQEYQSDITAIIVRGMPGSMPDRREVRERIMRLLMSLPQPGEEGYEGWDIPGVLLIPEEDDDVQPG